MATRRVRSRDVVVPPPSTLTRTRARPRAKGIARASVSHACNSLVTPASIMLRRKVEDLKTTPRRKTEGAKIGRSRKIRVGATAMRSAIRIAARRLPDLGIEAANFLTDDSWAG